MKPIDIILLVLAVVLILVGVILILQIKKYKTTIRFIYSVIEDPVEQKINVIVEDIKTKEVERKNGIKEYNTKKKEIEKVYDVKIDAINKKAASDSKGKDPKFANEIKLQASEQVNALVNEKTLAVNDLAFKYEKYLCSDKEMKILENDIAFVKKQIKYAKKHEYIINNTNK